MVAIPFIFRIFSTDKFIRTEWNNEIVSQSRLFSGFFQHEFEKLLESYLSNKSQSRLFSGFFQHRFTDYVIDLLGKSQSRLFSGFFQPMRNL